MLWYMVYFVLLSLGIHLAHGRPTFGFWMFIERPFVITLDIQWLSVLRTTFGHKSKVLDIIRTNFRREMNVLCYMELYAEYETLL